jgi:hypothetical protein
MVFMQWHDTRLSQIMLGTVQPQILYISEFRRFPLGHHTRRIIYTQLERART